MKQLQKYALFIVSLVLLPLAAKADVAPIGSNPFDGECLCELQCNGEVLRFYQVEFTTRNGVGSQYPGVAAKSCEDAGAVKRGLKSLKADITVRAATARFCKYGGDKAEACSVDGACEEAKVTCTFKNPVSEGEG